MERFFNNERYCRWYMHGIGKIIYIHMYIWGFPLVGVPRSGWFVMENPSEMDD
jgi:hypothetical protein